MRFSLRCYTRVQISNLSKLAHVSIRTCFGTCHMRYTQQNMSLHRSKKLRQRTSRTSQCCTGTSGESRTYSAGAGHDQHRDGKKRTHGVLLFQGYSGVSYSVVNKVFNMILALKKHRLAVASVCGRHEPIPPAASLAHVTAYVRHPEASLVIRNIGANPS